MKTEQIEKLLFDCIVAVGVREEGTVRDLDTLIIDRQKAVDKLSDLLHQAVREELEAVLALATNSTPLEDAAYMCYHLQDRIKELAEEKDK